MPRACRRGGKRSCRRHCRSARSAPARRRPPRADSRSSPATARLATDERAVEPAHAPVRAVRAIEVADVAPCSPWMRTGTPATQAGTIASSAARLRVWTIAGAARNSR